MKDAYFPTGCQFIKRRDVLLLPESFLTITVPWICESLIIKTIVAQC